VLAPLEAGVEHTVQHALRGAQACPWVMSPTQDQQRRQSWIKRYNIAQTLRLRDRHETTTSAAGLDIESGHIKNVISWNVVRNSATSTATDSHFFLGRYGCTRTGETTGDFRKVTPAGPARVQGWGRRHPGGGARLRGLPANSVAWTVRIFTRVLLLWVEGLLGL